MTNSSSELQKTKGIPINDQAPTQAGFGIPQSHAEHTATILRLVSGGSSEAEAEHLIAARKTAFNKANREYRKSVNSRTRDPIKKTKKNQASPSHQDRLGLFMIRIASLSLCLGLPNKKNTITEMLIENEIDVCYVCKNWK
jgi:hypothetical protein